MAARVRAVRSFFCTPSHCVHCVQVIETSERVNGPASVRVNRAGAHWEWETLRFKITRICLRWWCFFMVLILLFQQNKCKIDAMFIQRGKWNERRDGRAHQHNYTNFNGHFRCVFFSWFTNRLEIFVQIEVEKSKCWRVRGESGRGA